MDNHYRDLEGKRRDRHPPLADSASSAGHTMVEESSELSLPIAKRSHRSGQGAAESSDCVKVLSDNFGLLQRPTNAT